jgi:hypothetical protein
VADFERELESLFQTPGDDALGERLTAVAMDRIEREDHRRQWVLSAAAAAGLAVCVSTIVGSGILGDAGRVSLQALEALQHVLDKPLALAAAAALFAAYAVATLRPGRAL